MLPIRYYVMATFLAAAFIFAGCSAGLTEHPVMVENASSLSTVEPHIEHVPNLAASTELSDIGAGPVSVVARQAKGSGVISYDEPDGEALNTEQERLLLDYMDMYYQSLSYLESEDPTPLFATNSKDRALTRKSAWQVIIDVRKAQRADLSLTAFSYELLCTDIGINDDGSVSISVREKAVQNFTAFPGVDSESHNVYHRFELTDTDERWRLHSHTQMDSANMVAIGSMMWRDLRRDGAAGNANPESTDVETQLAQQHDNVLKSHMENLAERERQSVTYDPSTPPAASWAHDYDRQSAVAYAMKWVETRNADNWPTYDRNGGNCANYTSQCLFAGGIPMDYFGTNQWKWYGSSPSTAQAASGRSGSWSGVKEFYAYAANNIDYGMAADVDANYWSGEPGDLIQLGYEDNWRHVVIITDVIKDENDNIVDYLINSNTADQRSFPVSAYLYPQHRLIKVYGWKEA